MIKETILDFYALALDFIRWGSKLRIKLQVGFGPVVLGLYKFLHICLHFLFSIAIEQSICLCLHRVSSLFFSLFLLIFCYSLLRYKALTA